MLCPYCMEDMETEECNFSKAKGILKIYQCESCGYCVENMNYHSKEKGKQKYVILNIITPKNCEPIDLHLQRNFESSFRRVLISAENDFKTNLFDNVDYDYGDMYDIDHEM